MLNNKKGISLIVLVLIIVAVIAIGSFAVVIVMNKDNDTDVNNGDINNSPIINNPNPGYDSNKGNENSQNNNKISMSKVMAAPESPEKDFEITDYGDGIVEISKYIGDDEIVVIPTTINGKTITRIGAYVFANNYHTKTKAVRLSDNVKSINTGAFGLNETLEIFVSGSGLEKIGEGAFQNCINLKTVVLNNGLVSLESACFSSCSNLNEIEIPETVVNIHRLSFYYAPKNFVIKGKSGSVAETYAKENNITFVAK